jgi:hypothetical protein
MFWAGFFVGGFLWVPVALVLCSLLFAAREERR